MKQKKRMRFIKILSLILLFCMVSEIGINGTAFSVYTKSFDRAGKIRNWNRTMMNMDAGSVQEAVENVDEPVKVAVLDSGIDAMPEIPVAGRVNFIPGEDEMTEMYEDATGHGTAVASVMAFHKVEETGDEGIYEGYTYKFCKDELEFIDEYLEYMEPEIRADDADTNAGVGEEKPEGAIRLGEFIEENQAHFEGINPNMEIYSIRVLDDMDEPSVKRIIAGIRWAMKNDVKIINISFGLENDDPRLHKIIKKAYKKGMLIIASAGNQGEVQYPAAYDEVIAVGSVSYTGKVDAKCKNDKYIELTAPGEGVLAAGAFGVETEAFGSGIAAGEVSAVASILWQQDTSVDNRFIRHLLRAGANKSDNAAFGYGIVDCKYSLSVLDDLKRAFEKNETADTYELMKKAGIKKNNGKLNILTNIAPSDKREKKYLKLVSEDVKEITRDYLNILKIGIRLQDRALCRLNSKKEFPAWHGYYKDYEYGNKKRSGNYIAGYLYLSRMAKFMNDGQGEDKSGNYLLEGSSYWQDVFDGLEMEGVINRNGINYDMDSEAKDEGPTWENIFKSKLYDKDGRKEGIVKQNDGHSLSISDQSLVVYGMALHTMTDTFSHSSFKCAYKDSQDPADWKIWKVGGKLIDYGNSNDSPKVRFQNFVAAKQAMLNSMDKIEIYDDGRVSIKQTSTLDFGSRNNYLKKTAGKTEKSCEDIVDIRDYMHYGIFKNEDGSVTKIPVAINVNYLKEGFGIEKLWRYASECEDEPELYLERMDMDKIFNTAYRFRTVKGMVEIPGANDDANVTVYVSLKKGSGAQRLILSAEGPQDEVFFVGINYNFKKGEDVKYIFEAKANGQTVWSTTVDAGVSFH